MGNMRILYKVPVCESEGQRLLKKCKNALITP
jgi:hypothetical protein